MNMCATSAKENFYAIIAIIAKTSLIFKLALPGQLGLELLLNDLKPL